MDIPFYLVKRSSNKTPFNEALIKTGGQFHQRHLFHSATFFPKSFSLFKFVLNNDYT